MINRPIFVGIELRDAMRDARVMDNRDSAFTASKLYHKMCAHYEAHITELDETIKTLKQTAAHNSLTINGDVFIDILGGESNAENM